MSSMNTQYLIHNLWIKSVKMCRDVGVGVGVSDDAIAVAKC